VVSTPEGTLLKDVAAGRVVSAGRRLIGNQARYFAESDSGELYATLFQGSCSSSTAPCFQRIQFLRATRVKESFLMWDERGVLWAVNPSTSAVSWTATGKKRINRGLEG